MVYVKKYIKQRITGNKILAYLGCFFFGVSLWFFLSEGQAILDQQLRTRPTDHQLVLGMTKDEDSPKRQRYLVFQNMHGGQGLGNIMNGLLAAHMLGEEFGWIVCVASTWTDFHKVFQARRHQSECQELEPFGAYTLELVNFGVAVNECFLQAQLAQTNRTVMYIRGNTYPRWTAVENKFWDRFYQPTPILIKALKWETPPSTVVHLRAPDDEDQDPRRGLDKRSLVLLGQTLPSDTFLVTNNVDWYDFYEQNFGWSNPGWSRVRHSEFEFPWGKRRKGGVTIDPNLELFADWYTILQAKRVFHTHSDFSLSAIHWRGTESATIMGTKLVGNEHELDLLDEPWRRESPMLPLVQRTGEELANCRPGLNNMASDMDDDDAVYDDESEDFALDKIV